METLISALCRLKSTSSKQVTEVEGKLSYKPSPEVSVLIENQKKS